MTRSRLGTLRTTFLERGEKQTWNQIQAITASKTESQFTQSSGHHQTVTKKRREALLNGAYRERLLSLESIQKTRTGFFK